jgi:predicted nucleic acid-binding protein
MPHFLDTNVLLYAISPHPDEAAKRAQADALLGQDDGALSVQVLQEFYVQATRANRPGRLPHDIAVGLIHAWSRFPVQALTLPIVDAALEIKASYGFSYWDSAIIAAARALGCQTLYTEDLTHGRTIDGITIINPFR